MCFVSQILLLWPQPFLLFLLKPLFFYSPTKQANATHSSSLRSWLLISPLSKPPSPTLKPRSPPIMVVPTSPSSPETVTMWKVSLAWQKVWEKWRACTLWWLQCYPMFPKITATFSPPKVALLESLARVPPRESNPVCHGILRHQLFQATYLGGTCIYIYIFSFIHEC